MIVNTLYIPIISLLVRKLTLREIAGKGYYMETQVVKWAAAYGGKLGPYTEYDSVQILPPPFVGTACISVLTKQRHGNVNREKQCIPVNNFAVQIFAVQI